MGVGIGPTRGSGGTVPDARRGTRGAERTMLLTRESIQRIVGWYGREVIAHEHMAIERRCYQHGNVTTFAHSIRVACLAVWLADRLHLWRRVDLGSLVRAALLHDYFLYDWHDHDGGAHRWHGFTHGGTALANALADFHLNRVEHDAIASHMFPLTPMPPRHVEGWLVTVADKVSATLETLSPDRFDRPALPAPSPRRTPPAPCPRDARTPARSAPPAGRRARTL